LAPRDSKQSPAPRLRQSPFWTPITPPRGSFFHAESQPTTTGLVLNLSEDAYQGDAQFVVTVDGTPVGGVRSVTASHSAGQTRQVALGALSVTAHQIGVKFINDAWGGTASTDRNLFLNSATYNGQAVVGSSASLMTNGTATFSVTGDQPLPAPNTTTSSGLVINVAEDAYLGDAQFTISVDGTQIGDIRTATASHASGQSQSFALDGALANGTHHVGITFINDAWGGSSSTDRNLYITGATLNGQTVAGSAADLYSNGTAGFDVTVGAPSSIKSTATLNVSEDAYQGDAQFIVQVDGQQRGGTYTASASHAAGQTQAITLTGITENFASHDIAVTFLNDAWGGTSGTDRNLYVDSIRFDGQSVAGGSAALYTAGVQHFTAYAPVNWTG
jgi:hypothetical protein